MASAPLIVVKGVDVLQNPAKFNSPFQFAITFDCVPPGIDSELEWKLIYVGSAEDETRDQELESVLVGPVGMGTSKFVFEAPPPDPTRILEKDIIGVTVILLTCHYREQEFIRIGYYVSNDYGDRPDLAENPPTPPSLQDVCRNILYQKPRVTRFPIRWTDQAPADEIPAQESQNPLERAQGEPSSSGSGSSSGTSRHDPLSWGLSNPPPSPPRNRAPPSTNSNPSSSSAAPQGSRPLAQADMEDEGEDIGDEEEEEEDEGDDDQSVDLEEEDLRDSDEGEADRAAGASAVHSTAHNTAHDHAEAVAMDDDS